MSSRRAGHTAASKTQLEKQDVLEFMDEEDLGEHHMPASALDNKDSKALAAGSFHQIESIKSLHGVYGRQILESLGYRGGSQSEDDYLVSDDGNEPMSAIKDKRSRKLIEKRDGRFGLGYEPTQQDLELLRLQRERVQASRAHGAFLG